jgi:hypothetical protein
MAGNDQSVSSIVTRTTDHCYLIPGFIYSNLSNLVDNISPGILHEQLSRDPVGFD